MAEQLRRVVLVGASGNIGAPLLNALLAASTFEVTVLTRKESSASFPEGVTVHKSDLSLDDLTVVFQGQDAVVSAVGAQGFASQKVMIDAAIEAGVKQFIPSEWSVNTLSDTARSIVPLFQQKYDIVEYLKSKEGNGLTWTGVCTGPLFDWGIQTGFLDFDLAKKSATICDDGDKMFTATNLQTVCQALINVLQRPEATANKYLYIASVKASQNTILNSIQKASGDKWQVTHTTTNDKIKQGNEMLAGGDFRGAFLLVQATIFGNKVGLRANYVDEEKQGFANELLGLPLEDADATIHRVLNGLKI